MKLLSRSEEIILLAVFKLEGNAYGISIRELIHKSTGTEWSFASIYDPLNKLTRKGYVRKYRGDPLPERGGRHKCLYEITTEGKKALLKIYRVHEKIWDDVPLKALK
ncbi:MAG: helix-turn-helix transcriptional regulator [Candidatus Aminicenantes bacterium]|nr:MAG: helix-turn-helix transcriptional regulator [Candidatus Aminicenantes bacterium]